MNQGEIWLVNLEPTIGAEMSKSRPALIVNDNGLGKLPLKIIVPITSWKEHYSIAPWMVRIEPTEVTGLSKTSSIDCFQIRSISQNRFVEKIGTVTSDKLNEVQEGIQRVIGV
ncbi:MAG: type II toxin-antitoxin system PemK/MazF family toxin [Lachnospiraceae bacterium]|jgi:mRNA interferase MazF|nr:type II toxin-antitoxin system PemK/MazF family toxin [Lachnospiraceae bacterium]